MTVMIIPVPAHESTSARMQVVINIQAEVMDSEAARHLANAWLLEHVGNLLGTTAAELVLGERLFWRYDVMLGLPNPAQPGSGALYRVGQIVLDASSGEVQNADALAEELQTHVASVTR